MDITRRTEDAPPIHTVDEARERVAELIGPALLRQLWLMLLDANGEQLPVLIPVDGIPLSPEPGSSAPVAAAISELLAVQAPGGSVILALERPGSAEPTAEDEAWAVELEASFGKLMCITGMFVAYDDGVCALSPELTA